MESYCWTHFDLLLWSSFFACFSLSCYFVMGNQKARFKDFKMPSEFLATTLRNRYLQMILIAPWYCKYWPITYHQGLIWVLFLVRHKTEQFRIGGILSDTQTQLQVCQILPSAMWTNFKQKCTWIVKGKCWIPPVASSVK